MKITSLYQLDSIEKEINLNEAIYTFFGSPEMQQHIDTLQKINRIISFFSIDRVIEFGTRFGGLSIFFALWAFLQDKEFYSFDIVKNIDIKTEKILKFFNTNYEIKDILGNKENIEYIKKLINEPKTVMVLCDAGKAAEFNIYADSLKKGDFILMHDYSYDKEFFEQQINRKVWNHYESWYEQIRESCEKNNIYGFDYLQDVAWFMGLKQ